MERKKAAIGATTLNCHIRRRKRRKASDKRKKEELIQLSPPFVLESTNEIRLRSNSQIIVASPSPPPPHCSIAVQKHISRGGGKEHKGEIRGLTEK